MNRRVEPGEVQIMIGADSVKLKITTLTVE